MLSEVARQTAEASPHWCWLSGETAGLATVIEEVTSRFREPAATVDSLTVVYDTGQNSAANHAVVEGSGIGFALSPSDHTALLAIPTADYRPVDGHRRHQALAAPVVDLHQ